MASNVSLTPAGDWAGDMRRFLQQALHVSMEVCSRTGEEACRHALILMTQSARALTRIAPKRRPVLENGRFKHLLRKGQYKAWAMAGHDMSYYYRYHAFALDQTAAGMHEIFANDKDRIARIGRRGLAKRSWMWGLSRLGLSGESRAIPGASAVYTYRKGQSIVGYAKEDRLSYIEKAMPAGWEPTVVARAGNKIMAQAALKLEGRWRSAMSRLDFGRMGETKRQALDIYFLRLNEAA